MLKVKAFNSKTGAKNVLKEPCSISYIVFKNATTKNQSIEDYENSMSNYTGFWVTEELNYTGFIVHVCRLKTCQGIHQ